MLSSSAPSSCADPLLADLASPASMQAHLTSLLHKLDALLPPFDQQPDWSASAFRWRGKTVLGTHIGWLEAIHTPHRLHFSDLQHITPQKEALWRNTRQFLAGRPANNALLTGARGVGKSSLVKALLTELAAEGLRVVEVDKHHLVDLMEIVTWLAPRPERFILFCDDLSFESGDEGYKALKSALDGSLAHASSNVLVYATSNRRHLLPEYFEENALTRHVGEEIHPADAVEEKISLSDRFGLWLSFYPFSQEEYLDAVQHWLAVLDRTSVSGVSGSQENAVEQTATGNRPAAPNAAAPDPAALRPERIRREALNWALSRGARSGRVAWQFACAYVGEHLSGEHQGLSLSEPSSTPASGSPIG